MRTVRYIADSLKWDHEGWFDYLTPQLYWLVESTKHQSYPKLLSWWAEQNVKERHLWPGNFTSRVGVKPTRDAGRERQEDCKEKVGAAWTADDIIRQIEVTRATPGASGNVQFSMKALMRNIGGIADKLKNGVCGAGAGAGNAVVGTRIAGEAADFCAANGRRRRLCT